MHFFIRVNPAPGGSRAGHVLAGLPWKLFTFIELFIGGVHLACPLRLTAVTDGHLDREMCGQGPLSTSVSLPRAAS